MGDEFQFKAEQYMYMAANSHLKLVVNNGKSRLGEYED